VLLLVDGPEEQCLAPDMHVDARRPPSTQCAGSLNFDPHLWFNLAQTTEVSGICPHFHKKAGSFMFAKCANPRCSAIFRHLHEGRLFTFEVNKEGCGASGYSPSAEVMGKVHGLYGLRYAWLCDRCAKRLDVTFDGDGEFQMVARAA